MLNHKIQMAQEWIEILREFPETIRPRLEQYVKWSANDYIARIDKKGRPELEKMAALTGVTAIGCGALAAAWNIPWHALDGSEESRIAALCDENFIKEAREIIAEIKPNAIFLIASQDESADAYLKRIDKALGKRPACIGVDSSCKVEFPDVRKIAAKHKFPIGWVLVSNPGNFITHPMCKKLSISCEGMPTQEFIDAYAPKNYVKPSVSVTDKISRIRKM